MLAKLLPLLVAVRGTSQVADLAAALLEGDEHACTIAVHQHLQWLADPSPRCGGSQWLPTLPAHAEIHSRGVGLFVGWVGASVTRYLGCANWQDQQAVLGEMLDQISSRSPQHAGTRMLTLAYLAQDRERCTDFLIQYHNELVSNLNRA